MPNESKDRAIGNIPGKQDDHFTPGKNYLFAIGINAYKNFDQLNNATKDIEDLAAILEKEYNFEKENIHKLTDAAATKANIIDEFERLRTKVNERDSVLIYYSGHGWMQQDTERGFWIPVDATKDHLSSFIANAELKDIVAAINAHHILLVSDSCFSASLLTRDVSGVMGSAISDWIKYPSRWAFVSGKGPVNDGELGQNSPFAQGIIQQLKENDGDAINIVRLADHVTQQVRFANNQLAELKPLDLSGHEGGQFVFVKKQSEKDDWASALARNTVGSYGAYLDKYPCGKYENEANQKLVDIGDEKEWNRTTRLDEAFAYRQYKQKYSKGLHIKEADAKIAAFNVEEPKPIIPTEPKPLKREPTIAPSEPEPKVHKPIRGDKILIATAVIGAVLILWFFVKPIFGSKAIDMDTKRDTKIEIKDIPAAPIKPALLAIHGVVKGTTGPIVKALVFNERTSSTIYTDLNGIFSMSNILQADSISSSTTVLDGDTISIFSTGYKIKSFVLALDTTSTYDQQLVPLEKNELMGQVKDSNGNRLSNVKVKVVGTGKFAITNKIGIYYLKNINEQSKIRPEYNGKEYSWFIFHLNNNRHDFTLTINNVSKK